MTERRFQRVSVIGLGYVGLPTAAMFASRQVEVIGVDVDPRAVAKINAGEIYIVEPDLDIVVRATVSGGFLRATSTPEPADAFLIAVPTPFSGDDHTPDLTYVRQAALSIAPVLVAGNLVVLESTSPVGATDEMERLLIEARPDLTFPAQVGDAAQINIAHCPERVLPGKVMRELITNDRVIGGATRTCSEAAITLYKTFVDAECVIASNPRTAEIAKLTENSFRDVNIAFANEMSVICDRLDIDVWELISLANRHPRVNILQPGPGVGGHCIAVDPWFIVSSAPEHANLIRTARQVNDAKPDWVIEKVNAAVGAHLAAHPDKTAKDVSLAVWGLTFKPDIDDLRESPSLGIARRLCTSHPGPMIAIEPNINTLPEGLEGATLLTGGDVAADVHVLLVDHSAFRDMPVPDGPRVDCRGFWA